MVVHIPSSVEQEWRGFCLPSSESEEEAKIPQCPWGCLQGTQWGWGQSPPLWAHHPGVASLRLGEKIILWGWSDIYVIQAFTISLLCVWAEELSGGGQWDVLVEMAAICYTGCCCLARKKKRIKKLILVNSGHSVLHERRFLLRANDETSSSHYSEEKNCHSWGVFSFLEASEFHISDKGTIFNNLEHEPADSIHGGHRAHERNGCWAITVFLQLLSILSHLVCSSVSVFVVRGQRGTVSLR